MSHENSHKELGVLKDLLLQVKKITTHSNKENNSAFLACET